MGSAFFQSAAGRAKRKMEWFLWIAACVCVAYYVMIILYAGITTDFSWIWAVTGALCALLALAERSGKTAALPVWIRGGFLAVLAAGCCLFLILFTGVIRGMIPHEGNEMDYIVVLGAQVRGSVPSLSLQYRLDQAADTARKHPQAKLILSGGQGSGENLSEAECMRRYLEEKGLEPARLLMEDRSTSTLENLRLCDELYGCAQKSCAIISNGFHTYRAVRIAKKYGYQNVWGIPAASSKILLVHNAVREVFALVNEWRKGTI